MANIVPQQIGDLATECHVIKDQSTDEVHSFVFDNEKAFI
jgi:hypothetical protein